MKNFHLTQWALLQLLTALIPIIIGAKDIISFQRKSEGGEATSLDFNALSYSWQFMPFM